LICVVLTKNQMQFGAPSIARPECDESPYRAMLGAPVSARKHTTAGERECFWFECFVHRVPWRLRLNGAIENEIP